MNRFPNPTLGRRQLLRNGGLALSMSAIVAACGSNRGGSDAPGRLGQVAPAPTLPEGSIDDVALLRTAQSIEHTAIDLYAAAAGTGALSSAETALVERFVTDHQRHSSELAALITAAGGQEFACANPFLVDRAVGPVLAAIGESDDIHRDVLFAAHAFENLAGASYQALVTALTDGDLRAQAMRIGGEELRHTAVLAQAINPDALLGPELFGESVMKDDEGFPVPYAIPSVFGRVSGIELVVGQRDEEGARTTLLLQTPAANSIVYEYMSC